MVGVGDDDLDLGLDLGFVEEEFGTNSGANGVNWDIEVVIGVAVGPRGTFGGLKFDATLG